ncbi:MAG: type VII secretion protein EccB [Mycobacterium sp.]
MPREPTTRLQVSGYRFALRRIECALLRRDVRAVNEPMRAHSASLAAGCLLATIALAVCAVVAVLRPQAALDHAEIVLGRESGALYVRVGDTWHPVLNLASARLIAATDAKPLPVRESDLSRTKRGPLLGIPGAPQLLAPPLHGDESAWTICDNDTDAPTTVVIGPAEARRLPAEQTILVTAGAGSPVYLLYHGARAMVDLADPAVARALRLEGRAPRVVSQPLLNAVPEAPPIAPPRITGQGGRGPAGLSGFTVGSVLRITRGDGDEYYAVLSAGVQRIGQVTADLLRLRDSQGSANVIAVAPDAIRATPVVNTLPVSTFPDRALTPLDGGGATRTTLCVTWTPPSGDVAFSVGNALPVPAGHAPVILAQADGRGPALDAVYLPPGRSADVRSGRTGTRYLVTDTGVRFAVHDDDAARRLGLPAAALPAPWPVLAGLPCGPELSRERASVARDAVAAGPP